MRACKTTAILAAVTVLLSLFLTGCGAKEPEVTKYRVDYCGQQARYTNAEESYEPGTEVELYMEFIATDTDYSFYLDGEAIPFDYDESKGFVIRFTMPKRDVKLEMKEVNSMMALPETTDPMKDLRTKIEDIDEKDSLFVPLGIDTILLTGGGTLMMELDDELEDALGETVTVAEDVKEVWLLPFGNGGYRTVVFIREDGTISAINMTKLLVDHELEVLDRLGGYQDVVSIESRQDPDAMLVEAVLSNGDRYLLDPYLK